MLIFVNKFEERKASVGSLAEGEGSADQGRCEQTQATNAFSMEIRQK